MKFKAAEVDTFHDPQRLFPHVADVCELTVSCPPGHYSASALANAVEACDAHLLNLNLTSDSTPEGHMVMELRASHRNAGSIARSLERHGYTVRLIREGNDIDHETLRDRVNELLARLEV